MRQPESRGHARARAAAAALVAAASVASPGRAAPERPPEVVRTYDAASYGTSVLLGRTAGIAVWDVSDPDRPIERQKLTLPGSVRALALDEERVLAAAGTHGLYVIELGSEGGEPTLLARFDTPGFAWDVVTHEGRVLLADGRYGIRVVDASTLPERPRQLALVPTRGEVVALALDGTLLASAEGPAGVRLWRLGASAAPTEVRLVGDVGNARDVALSAGLLVVAAGREGVLVFRADGDGRALRLGSLRLDEPAEHVAAAHDVAWVSCGTPELWRIDLTDPERLVALEPIRLHRSAPVGRVTAEAGRVLAAVDSAGLGLIDLSRPDEPVVRLPRERRLRIEGTRN